MTKEVVTLKDKASVRQILDVLKSNNHAYNGFPLVQNEPGTDTPKCVGLITRHALMVILSNLGRLEDCG
jgi:CBS domain-containing protein